MTAKTFEFEHPFNYRDKEYARLTARRPKVRDLRDFIKNLEKDSVSAMEKVLGNLCEVDDKVISELDLEDFNPMKKWFEDFLKPMMDESAES
jgi:hypothetical protein